jgi:predicted TIM-barrel fold metal-dependent hydrolase
LIVDNHGHVGKFEDADIVEGYDPELFLGHSHASYLSLMDAVGIDVAVLHTIRPWANQYHRRVMRENPGRFVSVCKIYEPEAHTEQNLENLRMYIEEWGFTGLYYDPPLASMLHFYTDKYKRLWELSDSLSIPVCVVSYRDNFHTLWAELLKVMADFPDLRIEIIHGLYPARLLTDDNRVVIPEAALELVRTYDVYLDILPGHRDGTYGPDDEVIKALYDTFGPSKLIWGSEFTKCDTPTVEQYTYQLHYLERRCPYMSKEDLRLILGENARRFFRLA